MENPLLRALREQIGGELYPTGFFKTSCTCGGKAWVDPIHYMLACFDCGTRLSKLSAIAKFLNLSIVANKEELIRSHAIAYSGDSTKLTFTDKVKKTGGLVPIRKSTEGWGHFIRRGLAGVKTDDIYFGVRKGDPFGFYGRIVVCGLPEGVILIDPMNESVVVKGTNQYPYLRFGELQSKGLMVITDSLYEMLAIMDRGWDALCIFGGNVQLKNVLLKLRVKEVYFWVRRDISMLRKSLSRFIIGEILEPKAAWECSQSEIIGLIHEAYPEIEREEEEVNRDEKRFRKNFSES